MFLATFGPKPPKIKKACITGLLSIARPSSTDAVRKDFEENPLCPGG